MKGDFIDMHQSGRKHTIKLRTSPCILLHGDIGIGQKCVDGWQMFPLRKQGNTVTLMSAASLVGKTSSCIDPSIPTMSVHSGPVVSLLGQTEVDAAEDNSTSSWRQRPGLHPEGWHTRPSGFTGSSEPSCCELTYFNDQGWESLCCEIWHFTYSEYNFFKLRKQQGF